MLTVEQIILLSRLSVVDHEIDVLKLSRKRIEDKLKAIAETHNNRDEMWDFYKEQQTD